MVISGLNIGIGPQRYATLRQTGQKRYQNTLPNVGAGQFISKVNIMVIIIVMVVPFGLVVIRIGNFRFRPIKFRKFRFIFISDNLSIMSHWFIFISYVLRVRGLGRNGAIRIGIRARFFIRVL
jgi:hypothetical protein